MEVSRDVLKIVDDLKADDPALEVVVINDSSESISSSLESVFQTMIMAVVVSMVIIWLFFGDMKASPIVGTSIPVSILAAPILMKAMGFSLNVITLSSLVLGVGMMVDNSIVVLESCFRNTKRGGFVEARNAALDGTKAVLESIIGGTVTTCVVFIPPGADQGHERTDVQASGLYHRILYGGILDLRHDHRTFMLYLYRPKEKQKIRLPGCCGPCRTATGAW